MMNKERRLQGKMQKGCRFDFHICSRECHCFVKHWLFGYALIEAGNTVLKRIGKKDGHRGCPLIASEESKHDNALAGNQNDFDFECCIWTYILAVTACHQKKPKKSQVQMENQV
eukprot:scaffold184291_cov14-Tisochrysis_lutea.AAC.1